MALDLYYNEPGAGESGKIANAGMAILTPAFNLLRKKTGVAISTHGDTKLYPGYANLAAEALKYNPHPGAWNFRRLLRNVSRHNTIMYFVGD